MCYYLQRFFLFGLVIVATVSADVSHLFPSNLNGYSYQQLPLFNGQFSFPISTPAPLPSSTLSFIQTPGPKYLPPQQPQLAPTFNPTQAPAPVPAPQVWQYYLI